MRSTLASLDVSHAPIFSPTSARVYAGGKQEAFTAQTHWKERGLKLATKVSGANRLR